MSKAFSHMGDEQRDAHTIMLMQQLSSAESIVRRIASNSLPHNLMVQLARDALAYIESKRRHYLAQYPD